MAYDVLSLYWEPPVHGNYHIQPRTGLGLGQLCKQGPCCLTPMAVLHRYCEQQLPYPHRIFSPLAE